MDIIMEPCLHHLDKMNIKSGRNSRLQTHTLKWYQAATLNIYYSEYSTLSGLPAPHQKKKKNWKIKIPFFLYNKVLIFYKIVFLKTVFSEQLEPVKEDNIK